MRPEQSPPSPFAGPWSEKKPNSLSLPPLFFGIRRTRHAILAGLAADAAGAIAAVAICRAMV